MNKQICNIFDICIHLRSYYDIDNVIYDDMPHKIFSNPKLDIILQSLKYEFQITLPYNSKNSKIIFLAYANPFLIFINKFKNKNI